MIRGHSPIRVLFQITSPEASELRPKSLFQLTTSELVRFSEGFTVPLLSVMHYGSASGDGSALDWTRYNPEMFQGVERINELKSLVHYGEAIPSLLECDFRQKSILILGSSVPWLELLVYYLGARKIITVEYRDIIWQPNLVDCTWECMTWEKFRDTTPNEPLDTFLSYSSIEHSGLGRYGDELDPDGDLKAMAVASRWITKEAQVLLAFPIGPDCIKFNRHRVYGPKRLQRLERILGGRKPTVVVPSLSNKSISHKPEAFSLDFAFAQPTGYDAQLLLRFCHD